MNAALDTHRIRLVDPDGFMRIVEQEADSPEEAVKLASHAGNIHWYEHVVEAVPE